MNYNNIGKYLEEIFGGTEFFLYTPKQLKAMFEGNTPNEGTKIIKSPEGNWPRA